MLPGKGKEPIFPKFWLYESPLENLLYNYSPPTETFYINPGDLERFMGTGIAIGVGIFYFIYSG